MYLSIHPDYLLLLEVGGILCLSHHFTVHMYSHARSVLNLEVVTLHPGIHYRSKVPIYQIHVYALFIRVNTSHEIIIKANLNVFHYREILHKCI